VEFKTGRSPRKTWRAGRGILARPVPEARLSCFSLLFAHDLFGKPVSNPHQVRGRPFPDHAHAAVEIRRRNLV
jgi:hypothetical protein